MNISSTFDIGTKPTMRNTTMYLTMPERLAVVKETNYTALFLLEYYLSVIAIKNYLLEDKKTAIATGFTLRSVQDNRRLLGKNNLFSVIKTTSGGMTWYLYCARKEGVYCNKYFDKLFGYNTVAHVYRNFTRKKVADILLKNKLNPMETCDISYLLECKHEKSVKTKNHSWGL